MAGSHMSKSFLLLAVSGLWTVPLVGQSRPPDDSQKERPYERYGGVADRVNVRGGILFADHGTLARVDSESLGAGTLVDLEDDLGLQSASRDARVDGYLRLGRRHRIRAGYIRLERGGDVQLQRRIQWGDEVFDVDVAVSSALDLTLLPANYRFAVVKTDRVDLGLSAGVFAMFVDAGVAAPSVPIDEAESLDFPLPVFGADVEIALAPRLFVLGGGEYFGLSFDQVDGSWREFRAAVEFYPVRNVGAGVAYRHVSIAVDGTGALGESVAGTEIFFDYEFYGPQVYVALAF